MIVSEGCLRELDYLLIVAPSFPRGSKVSNVFRRSLRELESYLLDAALASEIRSSPYGVATIY